MADHMRNRVYQAEGIFRDGHDECVGTVEGLQTYATAICKRAWFKRYPGQKREVNPLLIVRSAKEAKCLPSWADVHGEFNIWVSPTVFKPTRLDILHSLAHFLLEQHSWGNGTQLHDAHFVKLYLDLMERFYGSTKDTAVRKEFKALLLSLNVKTSERTEEQKQASRERWYARQVPDVREDLQEQLMELETLDGDD